MSRKRPEWVVGIDLGTTHCALAESSVQRPRVRVLDIPQLLEPGELGKSPLLPSFTYIPARGEFPPEQLQLPWAQGEDAKVIGMAARRLGARSPARLVSSAKSWICHGGVNRRAPILPWNSPDESAQISPFAAQVGYLEHLRAAWESRHEGSKLTAQDVVVTVPASFDASARELTTLAARDAGLGDVRLLEEPKAAFYDFIGHSDENIGLLRDAKLVLVVDVGGGTTDLTLLSVQPGTDPLRPELERIAVGGHLMLGGDNMDGALASYAVEKAQLDRPEDATQWSALVQSAREAKESLLGDDTLEQATITYQRRGRRLFRNTQSIPITRAEVERVLVDAFLPKVTASEAVIEKTRAGLTTLGLPYTRDVAIPRHVAAFLRRHIHAAEETGARVENGLPRPDAVLLNGGVFRSDSLSKRMADVLGHWFAQAPRMLPHTGLDTAVAMGAARSALARHGIGTSIQGGTARAYYLGIDDRKGQRKALCIAPLGMQDDSRAKVDDRTFKLKLDTSVSFPLYAYTGRRTDPAGTVVDIDDQLDVLPAVQTRMRGEGTPGQVEVNLEAQIDDLGGLALYLSTIELPPKRWRLELLGAAESSRAADEAAARAQAAKDAAHPETKTARALIETAMHDGSGAKARGLRRDLEACLGPRGQWNSATCRALADQLLEQAELRRESDHHELNWLRLLGWCLRPGVGAKRDPQRVDEFWRCFEQTPKKRSKACWAEWWVAWRRVAAGLDSERQATVLSTLEPWIWPPAKAPQGPRAHGLPEMLQLLAALDSLAASDKVRGGEAMLAKADKLGSYWPLGRIGGRMSVHAGDGEIVDVQTASRWCRQLLDLDWDKAQGAAFACASLARCGFDGTRDLPAEMRNEVAQRLEAARAPAPWIEMVTRPTELRDGDLARTLGDSLPAGLKLV